MSKKDSVLSRGYNLCKAHGGGNNERALFQRSVISKLSRLELEDKFFRAIENNVMLKKQNNFQEEKLKLLGTKLLRLSEQLKREANQNLSFQPFEKLVKDQEARIDELERTNKELQQRINSLKSQSSVQLYNKIVALARSRHSGRRIVGREGERNRGEQWDSNKHATEDAESEKPVLDNAEQMESGGISESSQEERVHPCDEDIKIKDANTDKVIEKLEEEVIEELDDSNHPESHNNQEQIYTTLANVMQVKSVLVQTDITKLYFDDLSRKLLQKESLILDLQNELKLTKVKQNVIGEVENLFNIINHKMTKDVTRKKKNIAKKDIQGANYSVEQLLQELQMERIQLQTQKTINNQLMQKLSGMQTKLDSFNITSRGNVVDNLQTDDKISGVPVDYSPAVKDSSLEQTEELTDTKTKILDDNLNLTEDVDTTSDITKIVLTNMEEMQRKYEGGTKSDAEEDVTKSSEGTLCSAGEVKGEPGGLRKDGEKIKNKLNSEEGEITPDAENIRSDDVNPELGEVVVGEGDGVTLELGEVVMDGGGGDSGSDRGNRVVDDATYDISSRSDSATPSVGSSCGSSCGQCLSDGEVPREISERVGSDDSNKSSLQLRVSKQPSQSTTNTNTVLSKGEIVPVEVKAELTLKAISEQLETCKMLIAAPSHSRYNNLNNIKT